jgi:AraC family transcriptional regulator
MRKAELQRDQGGTHLLRQAEPSPETTLQAITAMGRALNSPPPLAGAALRGAAWLTMPWQHGDMHDSLEALPSNVIVSYFGEDQEMIWRSDGKRYAGRTRRGTITIIPEGHDGRWDIKGPIGVAHVYLPNYRLLEAATLITGGKPIELLSRVCFEDGSAARILEVLSREAALEDSSSRLFIEQAVDLLAMQLVRSHSSFGSLPDPEPKGGLADWQVKRVTDWMRAHLDEEIGLDELAGLVQLSRFHFCTAFKKATGHSPHQWLVLLRINGAQRLLQISNLPVTEIALSVGYQTPSAFSAAFRKITGTTPTEYRRKL